MQMRNFDDRALDELARYFAALAVPMRLRLLDTLRDGERNVGELTALTGSTQANVSKHLARLAHGGFVERRAHGTSVYYRTADPGIFRLCDAVCGRIGERHVEQAGIQRVFAAGAAGRGRARAPTRR